MISRFFFLLCVVVCSLMPFFSALIYFFMYTFMLIGRFCFFFLYIFSYSSFSFFFLYIYTYFTNPNKKKKNSNTIFPPHPQNFFSIHHSSSFLLIFIIPPISQINKKNYSNHFFPALFYYVDVDP